MKGPSGVAATVYAFIKIINKHLNYLYSYPLHVGFEPVHNFMVVYCTFDQKYKDNNSKEVFKVPLHLGNVIINNS